MRKSNFLVKVLTVTVAATMAVAPVAAFADDDQPDNWAEETVDATGSEDEDGDTAGIPAKEKVDATEDDKTEAFDDIKAEGKEEDALYIEASKHDAAVTTGNLESVDGDALDSRSDDHAKVDTTVNGNINAGKSGAFLWATNGSEQTLKVNGNVKSENSSGVGVISGNAQSKDEEPSKATVFVDGDIDAKGNAVYAAAWNGSTTSVKVTGSVSGKDEYGAVEAQTNDNKCINEILIGGDVKGDKIGVGATSSKGSKNNIVIEGTVSAKNAAIMNEGNNTITVWKIETPGYTAVKWAYDEEAKENRYVEDKEAEKNIQYIIRVSQNDHAAIKVTDADGNALATVTGASGNTLEYACEGDKVLLKIDVADGYSVDAAYGDEGQTLKLTKDAAGNYYLEVPKNGGVSFSVKLTKKNDDDNADETKTVENRQTAGAFVLTDSAAIALINATPAGGSVTLSNLPGTGLSAQVVAHLLARRDITATVTFMFNGSFYKIVIPAGTDIAQLVSADGSISFVALAQAFGIAPV